MEGDIYPPPLHSDSQSYACGYKEFCNISLLKTPHQIPVVYDGTVMYKETKHQRHVQREVLCSNFGQATGYPNTPDRNYFFFF